MNTIEDKHDLGECEDLWGYTCEQCRVTYQENADYFALDKDDVGWEDHYK